MIYRLRKSILKRWAALTWRSPFRVLRRDGVFWLLNRNNFVDRNYGIFGDFECAQRRFFLAADADRPPFDAMIDIGANFGLYAVLVAARKMAGEVHAFEPDPRNRAQLQANLFLNNLTGVVAVHGAAVSAASGTLRLSLHQVTSTGTTRISADDEGAITVPAVSLDDVFPWSGKRLVIKMDIEGHELEALKGMERLLRENDCWLQVESFGENQPQVQAWMDRLGYQVLSRIDDDFYYARPRQG